MVDTTYFPQYLPTALPKNVDRTSIPSKGTSSTWIEFQLTEQSNLFLKLKKQEFTGQVIFEDYQGVESVLYMYLGRLNLCGWGHSSGQTLAKTFKGLLSTTALC